jgi:hypothetical protein
MKISAFYNPSKINRRVGGMQRLNLQGLKGESSNKGARSKQQACAESEVTLRLGLSSHQLLKPVASPVNYRETKWRQPWRNEVLGENFVTLPDIKQEIYPGAVIGYPKHEARLTTSTDCSYSTRYPLDLLRIC